MMKKLELIFTFLLLPLDYLALVFAGTAAYFLRFGSFFTEIRPVVFELSYREFFQIVSWVALFWIGIFALNGLYSAKRHSIFSDFSKIIVGSSAATLLIVVAFFFNFQLFSSRFIILSSWLLGILFVSLERLLIHLLKKIFYYRGIGTRKIAVIGSDKNAYDIISEFSSKKSYGLNVVRHFNNFDQEVMSVLSVLKSQNNLDDLILADTELNVDQKNQLVNFCLNNHLNYKFAASLLDTKIINFELTTVAGVPLIEVKRTRLDGWGRIWKRVFDILLGSILFILFSPLMLLAGLAVIFTSPGPMIVKLQRIGYDGQPFKLLKFRSMIKNAHELNAQMRSIRNDRPNAGPLWKMANDPRVTGVGRFLRRFSIDELPQLWNVIMGQMSLVGPRPHEPEEVARYQSYEKKLLALKPGITGSAQVSGRSNISWEEEVKLDTYYVENWTLGLDIQILLKTPKAVFSLKKDV